MDKEFEKILARVAVVYCVSVMDGAHFCSSTRESLKDYDGEFYDKNRAVIEDEILDGDEISKKYSSYIDKTVGDIGSEVRNRRKEFEKNLVINLSKDTYEKWR